MLFYSLLFNVTNGQEEKKDQMIKPYFFFQIPKFSRVVEVQILKNHNFHFHFKAREVFHKIKCAKQIMLSNKKCGGPEHLVFHNNTALQATLNTFFTGSRFGSGFGDYGQHGTY